MNAKVFIVLTLLTHGIVSATERAELYSSIGQPSVFWHDGEWQVYQDGRWIPYAATRPAPAVEPLYNPEPLVLPEPEPVATDNVYYDWGWGYGFPVFSTSHHRHFVKHRHFNSRPPASLNLNDRAIGSMGRTTIGIGQQSRGLGQTTIGIGRPNVGIGQTTIGIGQPTIGIGRPTIAIGPQVNTMSRQNHAHGEHTDSQR